MTEQRIPNTFAPRSLNKDFSIAEIRGLVKLSAISIKSIPPDILKSVFPELKQ